MTTGGGTVADPWILVQTLDNKGLVYRTFTQFLPHVYARVVQ